MSRVHFNFGKTLIVMINQFFSNAAVNKFDADFVLASTERFMNSNDLWEEFYEVVFKLSKKPKMPC